MSTEVSDDEWAKLGFAAEVAAQPKPVGNADAVSDDEWNSLGFSDAMPAAAPQEQPKPVGAATNTEQVFGPGIDATIDVAKRLADGSNVVALGEVAATMLSGVLATTAGGVKGGIEHIAGMVAGDPDSLDKSVSEIQRIAQKYTYQPKASSSKSVMDVLAKGGQDFEADIKRGGDQILDATGSPVAATAFHTYANVLPTMMGKGAIRPPATSARGERAAIGRVDQKAADMGVNLEARPADMEQQLVYAAERQEGLMTPGDAIPAVQEAVQKAASISKSYRNARYKESRSSEAYVDVQVAKDVSKDARDALSDYDLADMPLVDKRLTELDKMWAGDKWGDALTAKDRSMDLNKFYDWYRKINTMKPAATDLTQAAALGIVRGMAKSRLDAEFNADMIKGDVDSINKWKAALKSHGDYVKTFKESKVIRDMVEMEADTAEMRRWITGASAALPNAKVAGTVKELNRILGRESVEMQALRADLKLDILEPLLKEEPNVKQFVRGYDKMVRKNPALAKELMSEGELRDLAEISRSVERGKATNWQNIAEWDKTGTLGRFMFGHGLAKASARQGIGTAFLRAFTTPMGHNQRTRIINDYLGIDSRQSMFNTRAIQSVGMLETMQEQQEQPSN